MKSPTPIFRIFRTLLVSDRPIAFVPYLSVCETVHVFHMFALSKNMTSGSEKSCKFFRKIYVKVSFLHERCNV